jgi:hypothetical protein
VWLLAVGTANRRVVAVVSGFAVLNRTWVVFGCVWLGTNGTSRAISSTALRWVSIGLTFVASGGGSKRNVFGDIAFSVKHYESGSAKRFLRHFTDKGDNHRGSLLTLMAFRAGKPAWGLTHSKGRVIRFDFNTDIFWGCGSGDTVNKEVGPSLADSG